MRTRGRVDMPIVIRIPRSAGIKRQGAPRREPRDLLRPHRRAEGGGPLLARSTRTACCAGRSPTPTPSSSWNRRPATGRRRTASSAPTGPAIGAGRVAARRARTARWSRTAPWSRASATPPSSSPRAASRRAWSTSVRCPRSTRTCCSGAPGTGRRGRRARGAAHARVRRGDRGARDGAASTHLEAPDRSGHRLGHRRTRRPRSRTRYLPSVDRIVAAIQGDRGLLMPNASSRCRTSARASRTAEIVAVARRRGRRGRAEPAVGRGGDGEGRRRDPLPVRRSDRDPARRDRRRRAGRRAADHVRRGR